MDNYICIHGNKVELTEEQIKQLGFEVKKESPFERVKHGEDYCLINSHGIVEYDREVCHIIDDGRYNTANYCTDRTLMEQRALYETLNRLLWRYSMEHDGDKIDWTNTDNTKWCLWYDYRSCEYQIGCYNYSRWLEVVYFNSREIAKSAIKEIIEPFMKEHPEFKW